ncbi:MAG: SMP-30/gluconolactonase/LRE family protein [Devosia nanyangense]|uniref:SMP-30/gluconolactonase/LRE family protein n=1 Tax=Devosia nanyangense TaxID=1228055 RepID=A0A933P057_9HYPH|nr:SMP-30/gluconolactonase/LRE family protein [Devosia nanyangense]
MRDVKMLMDGIVLGECPRWHEGRLWFSDWGAKQMIAVDMDGRHEVIDRVDALPFSFDWAPDGRQLVIAKRTLHRREENGVLKPWVDLTDLAEMGWNEIVVDARGNTYINNINFAFPGGEFKPGYVGLVTPDGQARIVAEGVAFPNGMVVTPDNKTLIVGESFATSLTAFDIAADGSLSGRRLWAKLDGGPDGIAMDAEGAIWSSAGEKCIRVKDGGEVLETIDLDRFCFAAMLGGDDGKTLFMVCNEWTGSTQNLARTGRVYWTRVEVPGAGWPGR